MATLITKNSSTASAVPLAADLTQGELAVNVTDKKLYTKNSGGSVVQVGGDVVGPASSTDNAFTRFDSTTGKLLQNSTGATLSDTGAAVFTGSVDIAGNSTAGSNIKLYEDTDNGTNYVAFKAPDTIAANVTWTLPATDGSSAQVLSTNGSGTLSWATASSGGTPGGSTTQLQYNNAGAFGGISGVTTDGTRITNSTTLSVGAATPSTSGSGITFPATQSASSDANTLDDYEEGTWSPTITAGSGSFTTVSMSDGVYTKVGNIITCSGKINLTSIGTASGAINVTFPFNASSSAYSGCGFETDVAGFTCGIYPGSTSAFSVKQYNNTSAIVGGGAKIVLSITYRAA